MIKLKLKETLSNIKGSSNPNSDIEASDYLKDLKKERYKQNTELKREWSTYIMNFLEGWSIAILFILIVKGLGGMYLSDTVYVALITTTLFNILGLAYILCRHLSPTEENDKLN